MKYHQTVQLGRLKELVTYEPDTGIFRWRSKRSNSVPANSEAGSVGKNGYRLLTIDGRAYSAPQLAWLYVTGEWPKSIIRFVDGDKTNIRFNNLRDSEAVTLGLSYKDDGSPHESVHVSLVRGGRAKKGEGARNYYRNLRFQKEFGITLADYQRMFIAQDGKCDICRQPEVVKDRNGEIRWLAVDHCHKTDAVRALLCNSCNTGIGKLQDDPAILRAAATYIERHQQPLGDNVVRLTMKKDAP